VTANSGLALVSEVASALEAHGSIPCRLTVDDGGESWSLTLTFVADNVCASLGVLELTADLRRVRDVAQMRGFAETYGIDPAKLEALIGGAE
jgi:hypothetical protein